MSEPKRDEVEDGINAAVENGHMEVVGSNEAGQNLFQLTPDGINYVHKLIDDVLEQAAAFFAKQLDVPLYIARDLLIHRAAELKEMDK